jgi:hypothetical protein
MQPSSKIEIMKKAILKRKLLGFADRNELVYYKVFKQPQLSKEFKTDHFIHLRNKNGQEIIIPFTDTIFKLIEL